MKRWSALVVLVLAALGCRNASQPRLADPFLGRGTVPPPATGSYTPGSVAPPVVALPDPGATQAPAWSQPATITTPPTLTPPPTTPPSGWGTGSGFGQVPPPSAPALAGANTGLFTNQQAANIRVASPASSSAAVPAGMIAGGVDIMDLPVANMARGNQAQPRRSYRPHGDDPSSEIDAIQTVAWTAPAAASRGAAYDHDPDFRWLMGRLEYSQFDRRLRLRYTPLVDDGGEAGAGRIVLDESELLGDFQAGDFVVVQGVISSADTRHGLRYQVERIELQLPRP